MGLKQPANPRFEICPDLLNYEFLNFKIKTYKLETVSRRITPWLSLFKREKFAPSKFNQVSTIENSTTSASIIFTGTRRLHHDNHLTSLTELPVLATQNMIFSV